MQRAPSDSLRRRPLRDLALIGALVLVAVVLFRLPTLTALSAHTRIHIAANNSAHLPLFGLMALVLFALSCVLFRGRFPTRAPHYWMAFGAAAVLAVGTELVQLFGPRDADLLDLALDLLGAAAALGVLATFDRHLAGTRIQRPGFRLGVRLGAGLLLVLAALPVLLWAEAYRQRNERFPTLTGFDTYWERKFLEIADAELALTEPPADWDLTDEDRVGRWSGQGGANPLLRLREPYPDWRGYDSLRLGLYSVEDVPVRISITIRDLFHTRQFSDRFTGRYEIRPGPNEIEIDLDEVRTSPETREMDMAAIAGVTIYSFEPPQSFTLYVDEMRLVAEIRRTTRRTRAPALPRAPDCYHGSLETHIEQVTLQLLYSDALDLTDALSTHVQ